MGEVKASLLNFLFLTLCHPGKGRGPKDPLQRKLLNAIYHVFTTEMCFRYHVYMLRNDMHYLTNHFRIILSELITQRNCILFEII